MVIKQLLKSVAACCVILVVLGASIVHADDDVKESYAHLLRHRTILQEKRTKRNFILIHGLISLCETVT